MNSEVRWKIYRTQRPGKEKESINYGKKDILFTDCSDDQSETVETARKRPNEDSAIAGLIKKLKYSIIEENIFEKLAKQGPSSTSTNLNTFREYLRDWEASSIKIENFTSENYFLLKTAKTATKVPEIITISDDDKTENSPNQNEEKQADKPTTREFQYIFDSSSETEDQTANESKKKQTNTSVTYEAHESSNEPNKQPNYIIIFTISDDSDSEIEDQTANEPKEKQTNTSVTYEAHEELQPNFNTETPTPTEDEPLNQTLNESTELQKEKQTDTTTTHEVNEELQLNTHEPREFQYIYDSKSSNESTQVERETPLYTLLDRGEIVPTPTQMWLSLTDSDSSNEERNKETTKETEAQTTSTQNTTTCSSIDHEDNVPFHCFSQKDLKEHMRQSKEVATTLLRHHGVDLDHTRFLILQDKVEQVALIKPKSQNEHYTAMLQYLEDIIGSNRFKDPIDILAKRIEELNEQRTEKLNRLKVVEQGKEDLETVSYLKLENEILHLKNVIYQIYLLEATENMKEAKDIKKEAEDNLKRVLEKMAEKEIEKTLKTNKRLSQSLEKEKEKLEEHESTLAKVEKKLEESTRHRTKLDGEQKTEEEAVAKVLASLREETKGFQEEKNRLEAKLVKLKEDVDEKKLAMDLAIAELNIYLSTHENEKKKLMEMKTDYQQMCNDLKTKKTRIQEVRIKLKVGLLSTNIIDQEVRVKESEPDKVKKEKYQMEIVAKTRELDKATKVASKVEKKVQRLHEIMEASGMKAAQKKLDAINTKIEEIDKCINKSKVPIYILKHHKEMCQKE